MVTFARCAVLAVLLACGASAQAEEPPELEPLLGRLDRMAKLYRDNALRFSCEETVISYARGRSTKRYVYTYVYSDELGLRDYRVERNSKDPTRQVVHQGLLRAYTWVFLFERGRHAAYRYSLRGRDRVHGRDAWIVHFDPLPPIRDSLNEWVGEAWIDSETSQVLRVEADRLGGRNRPAPNPQRRLFVTEFEVVKNGMRFPSRVTIRSTRDHAPRLNRPTGIVFVQRYADYRFFGVRTTKEIFEHVHGVESPGG